MTETFKRFLDKMALDWVEGGCSASGYEFGLEEALYIKKKIDRILEDDRSYERKINP